MDSPRPGAGRGRRFSNPTYKRSRVEHAEIDQVVEQVLRERGRPYEIQPFNPWGYDERQFNAPGFGLSVGLLMRTPHGCYPEYHTSADNLQFVNPASLADSLAALRSIIGILERNRTYRNLSQKGAAARQARPLPPDWRRIGAAEPVGDALDPQPVGWVEHAAGHRATIRSRVRSSQRRG